MAAHINRGRNNKGNGFISKPSAGAGWGGPAKGSGKDIPRAEEFQPDNKAACEPNEDRRERKRRRSDEMETVLYEIAKNGEEHGTVRVQAADKLYQIYNGRPVERVIVDEQPIERDHIDPADLSPEAREELRAALERQMESERESRGVH